MPTVPPSAKPTASAVSSSTRPDDPDPYPRPLCADDHQRIAWTGTEPGAEVDRGSDAHQRDSDREEGDPEPEPAIRERRDRLDAGQELHERADEERVRKGADPDPGAEQPCNREHQDADCDVRLAEREGRVLGKSLMQHIPRREAELRLEERDDPGGEEEQADDQQRQTHGQRAAKARRDTHSLEGR